MQIDKEFEVGGFNVFYGYNGDGGYWFYFKKVVEKETGDWAIFLSVCKFYLEFGNC